MFLAMLLQGPDPQAAAHVAIPGPTEVFASVSVSNLIFHIA